jgi:3-(3-hydroxy-phenyl)propionate hydroxylase
MNKPPVVIVGMGPVGAILAFALHRQNVPVIILEKNEAVAEDQRAATIHPPTLEMLDDLGITERIMPLGLQSSVVRHWDRVTGEVVADFDMEALSEDTRYPFVLQYEHYKLVRLVQGLLETAPGVEVVFGADVTGISDDATPSVSFRDAAGQERTIQASHIVGADGAKSVVRKVAGIAFEGFTYDERFLKIMTPFDFGAGNSRYALRNFFSDPNEWCNLFKVRGEGPPGLWRVVFPARVGESDDEALDYGSVQARLKKFLPEKADYELSSLSIYHVHQRVAKTFRKESILLVGDAAHLNNPIGGMGMNGGIHDAINLAGKLAKVWHGEAADDLLDLYDRQRRTIAVDYVQAQTIRNKKLLDERDPEIRRRNLNALKEMAQGRARMRAYLRAVSLIDSVEASLRIV